MKSRHFFNKLSQVEIRSDIDTIVASLKKQVDQRRCDVSSKQFLLERDWDFMTWIVSSTYSLCDLVVETFRDPPHIQQIMSLVMQVTGWESYLRAFGTLLSVEMRDEPNKVPGGIVEMQIIADLCVRMESLLAVIQDELLEDATHTFGRYRGLLACSLKLFQRHVEVLCEGSPLAFTNLETTRILECPLDMANLKKPTLSDGGALAAGCNKVSPFQVEMFDLKAAVAALSGPPMVKLKMQAETEDEVFLLWEAGDKNVEQPPAVANIRTHVLSAQLKGHDTDHRGRVDYQLFSPLIDFNLKEESSLQPGRHTDAPAPWLKSSANVLSIKVADSCMGFPVSLYGSVFVTDSLDDKGIYLFHRERDDPQLINSKDEALFLVGPSRGLVVFDYLTFEFDLRMRFGDQQEDDLDFSQGTIEYNSIFNDPPFISDKLSSPLSTVELNYAPVRGALEATVEIKIVQDSSSFPASTECEDVENHLFDKLYGKISACYSSGTKEIVLFDSAISGTMFTVGDDGVLELWRRVLSVCVEDSLVVTVETWNDDDGGLSRMATKSSFVFTPVLCGEGRAIVPCDGFKMQIKVVWSALYIPELDD